MNVLLAAGPESNALFAVTVQGASRRPVARLAGQRRIMVPLNRLQSTYRQLLLAGYTILSVTRCRPVGDPPLSPHPVPAPSAAEEPPHLATPQAEETVLPPPVGQLPQQSRRGQTDETPFEEDVMVLLLSLLGGVIVLTLKVVQYLAQQREVRSRGQQRPTSPVADVQERGLIGQLLRS